MVALAKANQSAEGNVANGMNSADEVHVSEPGLAVLDVAGHDEDTVRAVMTALDKLWATSGISPVIHYPGQPGARVRIHADILRPGTGSRPLPAGRTHEDGGFGD
ncbi:DUF6207 family protein [Streptomyces sp. NBC_00354]|uniref:DUF6207 family protein n=1 Tax=Streptomyces sp. NBC_00354 TaxID=2975723 RepID=UPI002E267317